MFDWDVKPPARSWSTAARSSVGRPAAVAALVFGVTLLMSSVGWADRVVGPSAAGGRLEVQSMVLPGVLETGTPFDVVVSAVDTIGISAVQLTFQDQVQMLDARGVKAARLVAHLAGGQGGIWPVTAVAIGTDRDTRGQPYVRLLSINISDNRPGTDSLRKFWSQAQDRSYPKRNGLGKYANKDGTQIILKNKDIFTLVKPWWTTWEKNGHPKHWDWSGCKPKPQGIGPFGEVLHCWLKSHSNVRNALIWEDVNMANGQVTTKKYDDWSDTQKIELDVAVFYAWEWMDGGLDWFNGEWIQDPPPNLATFVPGEIVTTILDKDDAWRLYKGLVAHSLAVEIGGFVPWSVANFSADDLEVLFSSQALFTGGNITYGTLGFPEHHKIGYQINCQTIPAPPTTTFQWLVDKDLIRKDQYKTVARMLYWARDNMRHYGGGNEVVNVEAYWQYAGDTPASRVMSLTTYTDPVYQYTAGPFAWVAGCWGVTGFFQQSLRAVNIPVQNVYAGHSFPTFYTLGSALSHGDDVYGYYWKPTPWYPPQNVLISLNTFKSWFYTAQGDWNGSFFNLGRQRQELAINWVPDDWLEEYCTDVSNGLFHADGLIYEHFLGAYSSAHIYTVSQLEGLGLWFRLASKSLQQGVCPP